MIRLIFELRILGVVLGFRFSAAAWGTGITLTINNNPQIYVTYLSRSAVYNSKLTISKIRAPLNFGGVDVSDGFDSIWSWDNFPLVTAAATENRTRVSQVTIYDENFIYSIYSYTIWYFRMTYWYNIYIVSNIQSTWFIHF